MQRADIERLLPDVFALSARPGSVLDALLDVMEALHEPGEAVLDDIDTIFDPYGSPEPFVPWLTMWVGLEWLVERAPGTAEVIDAPSAFGPGVGRLRDVISVASAVAQRRGTNAGLQLLLQSATGVTGFEIAEPEDRPFHIDVTVPAEAAPYIALVERIVGRMKPAATTAAVTVADRSTPAPDPPSDEDGTVGGPDPG